MEVEDGVLGYLMQSRQGLNTYQLCISVSACEGESGIQVISADYIFCTDLFIDYESRIS